MVINPRLTKKSHQGLFKIFTINRALVEYESKGSIIVVLQTIWPDGRLAIKKDKKLASKFRNEHPLVTWQITDTDVILFASLICKKE